MDMVERVARALSVADGMHPESVSNDEDQVPAWTLYVADARAAMEAMRNPEDERMWARMTGKHYPNPEMQRQFTAMIDYALSEYPNQQAPHQ